VANETRKPKVFIDADVLFAGAASPSTQGASLVVLRMAEITLINAITSRQVLIEVERNLHAKLPDALPAFRLLVQRCLQVVADPEPAELADHEGKADPKDLPILVSALREGCSWLVTFNTRDYQPGEPDVTVLKPGDFVQEVRYLLGRMA
jgi:predicted nucleic acid-binding protein